MSNNVFLIFKDTVIYTHFRLLVLSASPCLLWHHVVIDLNGLYKSSSSLTNKSNTFTTSVDICSFSHTYHYTCLIYFEAPSGQLIACLKRNILTIALQKVRRPPNHLVCVLVPFAMDILVYMQINTFVWNMTSMIELKNLRLSSCTHVPLLKGQL